MEGIGEASVERAADTVGEAAPLLWCIPAANRYTLQVTSPDGLRLAVERLDGPFADVGELIEAL